MSNNNLFSIGEIAKTIGITRKIILNYEAKGLIQPDKKEGAIGNRYYTIDTFTNIRIIRTFQTLGLSLDEIREYFNASTDLHPIITRLEKMRDNLNTTIEKLYERTHMHENTIKEITIEPQTIYSRTYNAVSISDKTNLLRDTALEAMKNYGTDTSRRMYFTENSAQNPHEMTYCVAIPDESKGDYVVNVPQLRALSFFHYGPYEGIPEARNKLIAYAKDNNIRLSGKFRSLFIEGPPQHKDPAKFITEIIAIIE